MTTQIAVRLPDDIVAFLDELVAAGAGSRAQIVTRALARERRRRLAERDAAMYAASEPDPDMHALATWSSRQSLDHLD